MAEKVIFIGIILT